MSEHKKAGLTKPQWDLLCLVVDRGSCYVVERYKPGAVLREKGLATFYQPHWRDRLVETAAGRDLVRRVRGEQCQSN